MHENREIAVINPVVNEMVLAAYMAILAMIEAPGLYYQLFEYSLPFIILVRGRF